MVCLRCSSLAWLSIEEFGSSSVPFPVIHPMRLDWRICVFWIFIPYLELIYQLEGCFFISSMINWGYQTIFSDITSSHWWSPVETMKTIIPTAKSPWNPPGHGWLRIGSGGYGGFQLVMGEALVILHFNRVFPYKTILNHPAIGVSRYQHVFFWKQRSGGWFQIFKCYFI